MWHCVAFIQCSLENLCKIAVKLNYLLSIIDFTKKFLKWATESLTKWNWLIYKKILFLNQTISRKIRQKHDFANFIIAWNHSFIWNEKNEHKKKKKNYLPISRIFLFATEVALGNILKFPRMWLCFVFQAPKPQIENHAVISEILK